MKYFNIDITLPDLVNDWWGYDREDCFEGMATDDIFTSVNEFL